MLTSRFDEALVFARVLHASQVRKASGVPYFSHLMAVAATVLEYGGDEETAIAALLHDALEDQAAHFKPGFGMTGPERLRHEIELRFGAPVLAMVQAVTETDEDPKPPWKQRKLLYLEHLAAAPAGAHFICAADKLHNARCTLAGVRRHGEEAWKVFNANKKSQRWWYYSVLHELTMSGKVPEMLLDDLEAVVLELFPELEK